MDIESDTFTVGMPQKMQLDDYAIDYPFSMSSNNSSSDFVQVMMNYFLLSFSSLNALAMHLKRVSSVLKPDNYFRSLTIR
jgi:hypothetical protein